MTESSANFKNWRRVKLEKICKLIRGVTFSGNDISYSPADGYVPILRAGNISKNGKLILDKDLIWIPSNYITQDKYLQRADIVICISSGSPTLVGKTARLNSHYSGSIGAFCGIIRSTAPSVVDSEFLSYWFRSGDYYRWRDLQSRGANIQNLRLSQLSQAEVSIPPLREQKRIVAILNQKLNAVEQARAANFAQIESAQALLDAYLRQVFKSNEARQWKRELFGRFYRITAPIVDPTDPKYASMPHISGENINSGTCSLKYINSASEDGMTSGKYLFNSGDVLYSKLRPYLRKAVFVNFQGVCSADMYPLQVDLEFLNPKYVAWLLMTDDFTTFAVRESQRTRMPKLNRTQLASYLAPIPPLEIQKEIVSLLDWKYEMVQKTIKLLDKQLKGIKMLPSSLFDQAFKGEL